MINNIIDGKSYAAQLRSKVHAKTTDLKKDFNITPGLAVVLVGEDPASQVYVRNKSKQAIEADIKPIDRKLPASTSETELLEVVKELNNTADVNGILVQLPLPKHIESSNVLRAIDPAKDVDGFHPYNVGLLGSGQMNQSFIPCTPLGCILMLRRHIGDMSGKTAVVVGRSNIVGKPMAMLLLQENCTVTIAHSKTNNLAEVCRTADILIAAVGRPHMIKADWIKHGATVIDIGINRVATDKGTSRIVGDVEFDKALERAQAITPVPGGVGPMTIACLLANTVRAACMSNGLDTPNWTL